MAEKSVWISLVNTCAGAAIAIVGGFSTQWFMSSRQRREKQWEFQRQTLLDVQSDLNHIARAVVRNDEPYRTEWRRLTVLVERVDDVTIRDLVQQFKTEIGGRKLKEMEETFKQLNQRIGVFLRHGSTHS